MSLIYLEVHFNGHHSVECDQSRLDLKQKTQQQLYSLTRQRPAALFLWL
jgi:hypothetical protein